MVLQGSSVAWGAKTGNQERFLPYERDASLVTHWGCSICNLGAMAELSAGDTLALRSRLDGRLWRSLPTNTAWSHALVTLKRCSRRVIWWVLNPSLHSKYTLGFDCQESTVWSFSTSLRDTPMLAGRWRVWYQQRPFPAMSMTVHSRQTNSMSEPCVGSDPLPRCKPLLLIQPFLEQM